MTLEETRKLGIEFERRVQTMIPDSEYLEKLDTETIYSYLNQYQDKYIHEIFRNLDQVPSGSKLATHIDAVLQPLLKTDKISMEDATSHMGNVTDSNGVEIIDTARSVEYPLLSDFYMYLRSVSRVKKTFSFKGNGSGADLPIRVVPNQLVSLNDVWRLIETPHDSLRILRYPAAVLTRNTEQSTLTVIYDQYTEPEGIAVTYYKEPEHFGLMSGKACELSMDAFEELVSGAIDLYVQYVAGAEANKKRIEEARREAAKEAERNAARRGKQAE